MIQKFAGVSMSLFGEGAIKEMTPFIKREKVNKALIVTDEVLNKIGIVKKVTDILEEEDIKYSIFSEVTPNPSIKNVEDGIKLFEDCSCDFIIAIGGGSANDCAKAINILSTNGGDIRDYQGGNKAINKGNLLIAINTTAGTGSEVSRAFLITDDEKKQKLIFKDDYAMPSIAINDINLMVNLPKSITAQTGMDALTHSIEALISKNRFMLTDILAIKATEIIYHNLNKVVENLGDIKAREAMAYGQYIAGLSFGSAGLGLVHAIAHQLSVLYKTSHGLSNAIVLPEVMTFYKDVCKEQFSEIARVIAPDECIGKTKEKQSDIAINLVKELSNKIQTNVSLKEIGASYDDLDILASKALEDGCILSAPFIPEKDEIISIIKKLM